MPYSNSVLQDLVEGGGGGVNCNKQGRSPRSRHEVARGWDREGGGCPPPQMERKWKSENA